MTEIYIESILKSLPDKPLLRVDEVADFLRFKKRTIYAMYPEQLQGLQANNVILIYRQSVVDFIMSNNGKKKNEETENEIKHKINKQPSKKSRQSWVKKW